MQEDLKKQLEDIYQRIDGDDPSKMTSILDFIDQNFIEKEEIKDKIEIALKSTGNIPEGNNRLIHLQSHLRSLLEQLK